MKKHRANTAQRTDRQSWGAGERGRWGDHSPVTTYHSRAAAFTLVEILIVTVLMAILASVALSVVGDSASSQLRGAATTLARDIQYVQAEAINTGQTLQVDFVGKTQYQVIDPDGGVGGGPIVLPHPQGDYPAHGGQFVVDFNDPGPLRGVSIESAQFGGRPQLQLGKYGEPTAGGEVILRCRSYQVRITVAPVTGLVTIGDLEEAR